jgi:maltose alpha-D-glucosyltransferase/alpha-amylase
VESLPNFWHELIGNYLESCRIIAKRTAEMHSILGSATGPGFAAEPFGKLQQRSMYQSLRTLAGRLCRRLTEEKSTIPSSAHPLVERLLSAESELLRLIRQVLDSSLGGSRIRCHGNYVLEQLLYTGKDFVVIDFEGEPGRTIGERRLKKSPLHDVAAMVRSLDYAVQSVFLGLSSSRGRSAGLIRDEDRDVLGPWADAWYERVASAYASGYLEQMASTGLVPSSSDRLAVFLQILILEKALREIDLELTHRPEWLVVPLRGVVRFLEANANKAELKS